MTNALITPEQATDWTQSLINGLATIANPTADGQQDWTFVGHWDEDEIVIEYILPGRVPDYRIDNGYWEQSLWCDSGTGTDLATVMAAVIDEAEAEYRIDYDEDEDSDD